MIALWSYSTASYPPHTPQRPLSSLGSIDDEHTRLRLLVWLYEDKLKAAYELYIQGLQVPCWSVRVLILMPDRPSCAIIWSTSARRPLVCVLICTDGGDCALVDESVM